MRLPSLTQNYIALVATSGLVTLAFGSFAGVQMGNLMIDLLAVLLGAAAVVWHRSAYPRGITAVLLGMLGIASLILARAIGGGTGLGQALNSARGWILPMLPALYIIAVPSVRLDRVQRSVSAAFLFMGLFGLFQYVFSAQLPEALLTPPSDEVFGFYGTDHIRPTALIGNPIIYATVMVLGSCWGWSHWLTRRNPYDLLLLLVCLLAGGLTVTRAALIGGLVALAAIYLLYRQFRPLPTAGLLIGVSALGIAAYSWLSANPGSFLARRLLGTESTTRISDRIHLSQVNQALDVLREQWVTGLGLGSQSFGSATYIVSDGLWWAAALDFGLLFLVPIVLIGVALVVHLLRFSRQAQLAARPAALTALGFLVYAVPASTINSATGSRVALSFLWLVLAIAVAMRTEAKQPRQQKQEKQRHKRRKYVLRWRRRYALNGVYR